MPNFGSSEEPFCPHPQACVCVRETCTARRFSASCSVLEAPSKTALTPWFLRHQAVDTHTHR